MARLESVAIAGYYPTPERVVPLIAEHLVFTGTNYEQLRVCDPCAGEGTALLDLCTALHNRVDPYTCELEKTRHVALEDAVKNRCGWGSASNTLRGDAFRVAFRRPWAGLLFLNPPYDTDPEHGRLEHRFLNRFEGVLVEGGMLVFLVPHYALAVSAELLASEFEELDCFRFPDPEVEAYRQVVLFARRAVSRPLPDSKIVACVERWATAEGFAAMPVLGSTEPKKRGVPPGEWKSPGEEGKNWAMRRVDVVGLLAKAQPWRRSSKLGKLEPVPHILPELPVSELMFRKFPVATSPRPAHIAAGIASGLFNGREVRAKDKKLPPLLVKGVFEREYVTVEEKVGEEGFVKSIVQVQQPKLVVVVLDLKEGKYHELKPSNAGAGSMTIEGLLESYGPDLLRVMKEQCPVAYDPSDAATLPLFKPARPLFKAQAHTGHALLKLLGGAGVSRRRRRRQSAVLLGEIGSGKTSVALVVARTFARRVLVVCPPHLLTSWQNEIAAVVPSARVAVLQSIDDVDEFATFDDEFAVAILSRETAKLGHGYGSVRRMCPRCGARVKKEDHGRTRARCDARSVKVGMVKYPDPARPGKHLFRPDPLARAGYELALRIMPCAPDDGRVAAILSGRHMRKVLRRMVKRSEKKPWTGFDATWLANTTAETIAVLTTSETAPKLLGALIHARADDEFTLMLVERFVASEDYKLKDVASALVMLMGEGELKEKARGLSYRNDIVWDSYKSRLEAATSESGLHSTIGRIHKTPDGVKLDGAAPGSVALAQQILARLTVIGKFTLSEECGEILYQAVPEPRRYPLARYITKRYRDLFDLLVLDEAHEFSTSGDSAQSHAAQRLAGLGMPVLAMTGSVMNGYARSLFTTFQIVSEEFRSEFELSELQRFIDRYGYRKRVLSDRDRETGAPVEFGSQSDRVVRSERTAGDAPGVLPLFLFRHLLGRSVTLHKADLALELPPCRQFNEPVVATPELLTSYRELVDSLTAQIKADMFSEGLAGKLFGQLSELPSYLDRATVDVGNREGGGAYTVAYPESVGGAEIAHGKAFPETYLLPKEKWMLRLLERELDEGRNVMIFSWHVALLPRLKKIVEKKLGIIAPILDNVPTEKRQTWIEREVVAKNRRVMVCNPIKVQTGLNNLVHFATQVWHENPACNPVAFRQAVGRVDRIKQKLETRIYVPYYEGTLQETMHGLLMRKVAVSTATDGLDPESVLIAAGGSDDGALAGMSLGRQLWSILNREAEAAE